MRLARAWAVLLLGPLAWVQHGSGAVPAGISPGRAGIPVLWQSAALERQARQAYQVRDWAAAAAAYEEFHAAGGGTASTYDNLGVALTNLGRWAEAESAFRKAIDLDPEHRWAYNHLGFVYREEGRYDQAMAMFRRQIAISPKDPYAYRNLAGVLVLIGRLEEAEQAAATEEKYTYERGEVYLDMACNLNSQNHPDQAKKYLEKAKAAGAERGLLAQESAHYFLTLHDYRRAEEQYLKLLEYQPYEPLVALRLGMLYWETGNLEKAAAAFARVINVGEDASVTIRSSANTSKTVRFSDLQNNADAGRSVFGDVPVDLARAAMLVRLDGYRQEYRRSKSPAQAARLRAACQELLQQSNPIPVEAWLRDTLGWTLLAEGRMTAAEEELERAYALAPGRRMVAYHLAVALEQSGETEQAVEMYTRSLAALPAAQIECGCEEPDLAAREQAARAAYARWKGEAEGFAAYRKRLEQQK